MTLSLRKVRTGKVDRRAVKKLEDQLDAAASHFARQRDRLLCRRCGRKYRLAHLEAHHICKRRLMPTRWEPLNLVSLCVAPWKEEPCHVWAENHPDDARDWACNLLGEETYDALVTYSRGVARYTMEDLQEMLEAFKRGEPVERLEVAA